MASTGVTRIEGVDPAVAMKAPCVVATLSDITLSGAQTIDGVAVAETSPATRVLVRNQTVGSENGVYDVKGTAWVRSEDFDGNRDIVKGTAITSTGGASFPNTTFKVNTENPITIGSTALTFSIRSDGASAQLSISNYTLLIAEHAATPYSAGDLVTVTSLDIGGQGVIVGQAAHGLTSTRGKIVVLDANTYWERIETHGAWLPEWWEAVGDNSALDHAAIQEMWDFIETLAEHKVCWLSKNYRLGAGLAGRNYVSVAGHGTLTLDDAVNAAVMDIHAASPDRKIQGTSYVGFKIEGNAANQTTTDNILGAGFALRCDVVNPGVNGDQVNHVGEMEDITVSNVTSDNCKINGFYFGKNTFVGRGYAHSKLKARGNVNGIFMDDFFEYTSFSQCVLQLNSYGVRDNGASNISFIGGMSNNNSEAGFYLETTGRNTSKKIINGMHINHNKRGVWIGTGVGTVGLRHDQIIITNNDILANDNQGVVGSGGDRVIVKGNVFSGNGHGTPGLADDIDMANNCREWDIDNTHLNSTGDTRYAVHFDNSAPFGTDVHNYHKIDGTFEGYANPIGVDFASDPSVSPDNANTNFIQGVFEYYATAGNDPSAATGNRAVDVNKIPLGTICVNNIDNTGAERWRAVAAPSSSGSGTARAIAVVFERVAVYV